MTRSSISTAILVTVITITGCASKSYYWHSPSKTQQQFYEDNSQCTAMSNSGGNMNQPGQPGKYVDLSGLQNAVGQAADWERRQNIQTQCMYGKGWQLKEEKNG